MGILKKLFSAKQEEPKKTITEETPVQQEQPKAPKGIIKTQRHKLANLEAHMEDIVDLLEKNEDYKLSKKALIEDCRENEKIYEFELSETAGIFPGGGGELQVFVDNTHIGDIKKGSVAKVKKLLASGTIKSIETEVSGGNYKILSYYGDKYELDELEDAFSITIEITYREEIEE